MIFMCLDSKHVGLAVALFRVPECASIHLAMSDAVRFRICTPTVGAPTKRNRHVNQIS